MNEGHLHNQLLAGFLKSVKFYFESQLMRHVQLVETLTLESLEARMQQLDSEITIAYASFVGEPKGKMIAAIPDALNSILVEELLDLEGQAANLGQKGQHRAAASQFINTLAGLFRGQMQRSGITLELRNALAANDAGDMRHLLKDSQKRWLVEFDADGLMVFISLMI